ncbi:MAG: gliding motility protein GldN [Bacteroidales bacterium]|nr:gliding motility protein GldN [Bacteroidales bacterium]
MKKTLVSMLTLAALFGSLSLNAQTTDIKPPKNSILSNRQEIINEKKASPLPNIDESTVMWKKTVIREIDFRQKINQVFYYPINPTEDWRNLITVIYDGIMSGDITPYRVENNIDDMVTPLTLADFEKENSKIGDPPVIWSEELGTEVPNEIAFKDRMLNVLRLRIKEDWYFDKKLSQFLVRIIALGPIVVDDDGGLSQVCWIPYEDSRDVLAKAFAFNRNNAAQRLTYDEVLQKRIFDSYIVKEENVYDRYINSYAFNIDALYESERIKNEMFDFEQSLWEY